MFMSADAFDYVIVGGGTSGCVLANRLSEKKGSKVLVLEAGGSSDNKLIKVPTATVKLFRSMFDWVFESHKEKACADRDIYLPRGKALGGSSCINVMLYHRGDKKDYEKWSEATGARHLWSPDSVLPYFKKAEANKVMKNSEYHNQGGLMSVDHVQYQNPLSKMFLSACKNLGFAEKEDFNDWSQSQEGVGRFQVTQKRGRRWTSAMSYLKKAKRRSNLEVETNAHATKVTVEDGKAKSVIYRQGDELVEAKVAPEGEILLTAGAIQSPHLLMLSGIGDENELQQHNIPVVQNLPGVGKNMQDHPAVVVARDAEDIGLSHALFKKGTNEVRPLQALKWALTGKGPLTSVGCDHGGFFKTKPDLESPDVQLRFIAGRGNNPDGLAAYTEIGQSENGFRPGISLQVIGIRAKSQGTVKLASANPMDKPRVESGFLTNPEDVETLKNGIKIARQIAESDAFEGKVHQEVFPGKEINDDASMEQYIRSTVHTANAIVGTCRMGRRDDPEAVVDPELKVIGVDGLRVVDSSVMPNIPGGQTGAPTVMLAEKAADLIMA